ncbi:hypothetical protein ACPV5A_13125 [Vibrio chagasii]|uniref:hypothetical protein n=1 Tax=Vibrio chagasii TaxID=170679 RepID=UPI004068E94E
MIDFETRLGKLKERRHGSFSTTILKAAGLESNQATFDSLSNVSESYESLKESAAIKYTIGAMMEVDPEYTKVSVRTGERVAETLTSLLSTDGKSVVYRMQGSVPLNIHIKGHSDVDMLIINQPDILVQYPKKQSSNYLPPTDKRPMEDVLKDLREQCEKRLTNRYPQVSVDCSNAKSIAMEGGSLQRKVDIVPACWFDTLEYQESWQEIHRGVKIYHKKDHELIGNSPFKHIHLVNQKDAFYGGNLKKLVRLLKNLVADMPDGKKSVAKELSSFDLVSIVYIMNDLLICSEYTPLLLVDRLLTQLTALIENPLSAASVKVPDGSREIFDNEDKISALRIIHAEIESLRDSIYKDLTQGAMVFDSQKLVDKRIFV